MHMKLYELRKAKKMTQKELAKVIGKTTQQYGKRERGEVPITLDEASQIAKCLGYAVYEVFPEYFFTPIVPKMHNDDLYT